VVTAATCSNCGRAVRVVVTMRSPRGPYQLFARCLGPDAAPPTPTSDAERADSNARVASVVDVLAWFEEHADRIEGWTQRSGRPDDRHYPRGQA
jgi:hypothetical protein